MIPQRIATSASSGVEIKLNIIELFRDRESTERIVYLHRRQSFRILIINRYVTFFESVAISSQEKRKKERMAVKWYPPIIHKDYAMKIAKI